MDYSQYKQLEFRRKFWKLFGATIRMTAPGGSPELGVVQMKAFRLKNDITLYADSTQQRPIVNIKARQAIAMNYVFDVSDPQTSQTIFSLERKGLKSAFVRDHWLLLDTGGNQFGEVIETSSSLALFRRWLSILSDLFDIVFAFVSETYTIQTTGAQPQLIGTVVHQKNPFIVKMTLDTSQAQAAIDPRVAIASCILLAIRDASKNN
jgi:hypothetical protein